MPAPTSPTRQATHANPSPRSSEILIRFAPSLHLHRDWPDWSHSVTRCEQGAVSPAAVSEDTLLRNSSTADPITTLQRCFMRPAVSLMKPVAPL